MFAQQTFLKIKVNRFYVSTFVIYRFSNELCRK